MLALEDDLISEYISFQKGKRSGYNKDTIIKLFKYLYLPFKMSVQQKNDIGLSDEVAKSLADNGTVKIRNFVDEEALINATKLKVMLAKDRSCGTYPYINILDDETDVGFTATYKSGANRDKAIAHIRALLKDADSIKIYDKYLSKINYTNDSWSINKQVLLDILPRKTVKIDVYCEYNWTISRENDLTRVCTEWTINRELWDTTVHDRYIETDKVVILLSSGIINLSTASTKDFTYVVKVK